MKDELRESQEEVCSFTNYFKLKLSEKWTIPNDIIHLFLTFCSIPDLLYLSLVNKKFYNLIKTNEYCCKMYCISGKMDPEVFIIAKQRMEYTWIWWGEFVRKGPWDETIDNLSIGDIGDGFGFNYIYASNDQPYTEIGYFSEWNLDRSLEYTSFYTLGQW